MFLKKIILQFRIFKKSFFVLLGCSLLFVCCATPKNNNAITYHDIKQNTEGALNLTDKKEVFFDILSIATANLLNSQSESLNFDYGYNESIDMSIASDISLSVSNVYKKLRSLVTQESYINKNKEIKDVMQAAAKNLSHCNTAQLITYLIYEHVISLENNCTPLSSLTDEFNQLNSEEQDFILNAALIAYNRSDEMLCRTFPQEYYEYPHRKNRNLPNYLSRYIKDNSEYLPTKSYTSWDPYAYLPFAIVQMYFTSSSGNYESEIVQFDPSDSRFEIIANKKNESINDAQQNFIFPSVISDDMILAQSFRISDWTKKQIYYNYDQSPIGYYNYKSEFEEPILVFTEDDNIKDSFSSESEWREFNSDKIIRSRGYDEVKNYRKLYKFYRDYTYITYSFGSDLSTFFSSRAVARGRFNNRRKIRKLKYTRLWAETAILASHFIANKTAELYFEKNKVAVRNDKTTSEIANLIMDNNFKYTIHFARQYGSWNFDLCENQIPSDGLIATQAFRSFYEDLPNDEFVRKLNIVNTKFESFWVREAAITNQSKRNSMEYEIEQARGYQREREDLAMQRQQEEYQYKQEQRQQNFNNAINALNYIQQHNQERNTRIATNNRTSTANTRSNRESSIPTNNQTPARNNTTNRQTQENEPTAQTSSAEIDCGDRRFTLPNHLRSGEFQGGQTRLIHPSDTWSYSYLRTEQDDNCGNSTLVFEATVKNPDSWKSVKGLQAGHTIYFNENHIKNELIPYFGNTLAPRSIRGRINDEFNPAPGVGSRSNYAFTFSSNYELVELNLYERENNSSNEGNSQQINQGQGHFYVTDLRIIVKVDVSYNN